MAVVDDPGELRTQAGAGSTCLRLRKCPLRRGEFLVDRTAGGSELADCS